ncbi:glycosyltransferase [Methylopila sp. 73B]|uniref:glycosyltransferase n=1 Tax=Methylopila sp. 73B TaxID=1120792 RepID=UPI0003805238|nr:glycosyltransferase [Methylopila sp. 73B]
MSRAPIGYYVHHQGEGHRRRAAAIAALAPGRFTLIGTGVAGMHGPFETLDIPDDRPQADGFDGRDDAAERPEALHYAPYNHDGVRARALAIAGWIAERRPALLVVDVSVEVAMLARLCATPTVYVRLAGDRSDPAHLDAFRGAQALLAPFDERLEDPRTPDWVRAKTRYVSGLAVAPKPAAPDDNVVMVAFGRGGSRVTGADLAAAAGATPGREWRVIGPGEPPTPCPDNLNVLGWTDDPERAIAAAGVVVGGAGDGVLGAVAAAGRPFVCVPEDRAYGEQAAKAAALEALGAAVVRPRWPNAADWPATLDAAGRLDTRRIAGLHDPAGLAKAAAFILDQATS